MKSEVKELWVAALESGKYKQGRGVLRDDQQQFCCLGVLADLHRKETGGRWKVQSRGDDSRAYLGSTGVLPQEVMDWAELKDDNPTAGSLSLAEHNDNGNSFAKIASIIRNHL